MVTDVDGSRFIMYKAAWSIAEGLPSEMLASMAKAWTSDAYKRVTLLAHQIFGAIGFTMDHDMHLYFRRAKAGELAYGDADFHRNIVAAATQQITDQYSSREGLLNDFPGSPFRPILNSNTRLQQLVTYPVSLFPLFCLAELSCAGGFYLLSWQLCPYQPGLPAM